MSGTLFRGLNDIYPVLTGAAPSKGQGYIVYPGQVLDVCLDNASKLYSSPRDIGAITFRDLLNQINKPEASLNTIAYPLDRTILQYPMPGEQVMIYQAYGEATGPSQLVMPVIFFYSTVVSMHHNVTFNSNPFLGTDSDHLSNSNTLLSNLLGDAQDNQSKTRFDKKIQSLKSVKSGNDIKVYKQLIPEEGDFILQGRFGTSVRFSSTQEEKKVSPLSLLGSNQNKEVSTGLPGDGIIKFRVDRQYATNETDMMTKEDLNKDDSSLYMCTSQRIELNLACSKELKSWKTRYGLKDPAGATIDHLSTQKDPSQLWQKLEFTSGSI